MSFRFKSIDFTDFYVRKTAQPPLPVAEGFLQINYLDNIYIGDGPQKIADLLMVPDNGTYYDENDYVYELVSGQGDTDNGELYIIGRELFSSVDIKDFDFRVGARHTTGYVEEVNATKTYGERLYTLYNSLAADFDGTGTNYLSSDGDAFGIQDEISLGAWVNMDAYVAPPSTFAVNSPVMTGTQAFGLANGNSSIEPSLSDFSHGVWFKSTNTATQMILNRYDPSITKGMDVYISGAVINVRIESSGSDYRLYSFPSAPYLGTDFQFLSVDWIQSTQTFNVYIDNAPVTLTPVTSLGTVQLDFSDCAVSFGYRQPSSNLFLQGSVSFGYWKNVILTTQERTDMYNGGVPKCYASLGITLDGQWDLCNYNSNTGNEGTDNTGNVNNLSVVGSPTYTDQGLTVECDAGAPAVAVQGVVQKGEIDTEGYTMSRRIENGENLIDFNLVTGTSTNTTISSTDLATGQWKFLAATYNNVEGLMRLYVDGVNVVTSANIAANMNVSANDLLVGNLNTLDGLFQGCMMFPFVANKKFIDSQISLMYNGGNPIRYEDLEIDSDVTTDMVGHWNLADWNNGAHTGDELVNNVPPTVGSGTYPLSAMNTTGAGSVWTNDSSFDMSALKASGMSISLFVNTTSVPTTYLANFSSDSADGTPVELALKIQGVIGGIGDFSVEGYNGAGFETIVTNITISNEGLTHVGLTLNSGGSLATLYIDGVSISTGNLSNLNVSSTGRLAIGEGQFGNLYFPTNGLKAMPRVTNREITPAEMLYFAQNPSVCYNDIDNTAGLKDATIYAPTLGEYNGSTNQALVDPASGIATNQTGTVTYDGTGLSVDCETTVTNDLVDNGSIPFDCTGVDVASNEPVNP